MNGSFVHKFNVREAKIFQLSQIDLSENITQVIQYNYTIADRHEAILGLLGCLTYGLNAIERGGIAHFATVLDRPVVCSSSDLHVTANATDHHAVGVWLVKLARPRVMQWAVLFICFMSYLIAVT